MIIDEYHLVSAYSQAEQAPAKLSSRTKNRVAVMSFTETVQHVEHPVAAMHSIDELSIIGCVDSMPVMQSSRRVRAPANMCARPRLGRPRPVSKARAVPTKTSPKSAPRKVSSTRRKPLSLEHDTRKTPTTYRSLITNLTTTDLAMKEAALDLAENPISSEPVLPIHTAIRIVLQATFDLGRPYDTNMLAATFGVTRSLVMQALRKHYDNFIEQSLFTEAHFVPTYLWLYGQQGEDAMDRIVNAIKISGAAEPGCRSVFAIARDFVILYISEVVYGPHETRAELAGLSSVSALMAAITPDPTVPQGFLEMTNTFLYRARMTGRLVMKEKTSLIRERGGMLGSLFTPSES